MSLYKLFQDQMKDYTNSREMYIKQLEEINKSCKKDFDDIYADIYGNIYKRNSFKNNKLEDKKKMMS